MDELKSIVS